MGHMQTFILRLVENLEVSFRDLMEGYKPQPFNRNRLQEKLSNDELGYSCFNSLSIEDEAHGYFHHLATNKGFKNNIGWNSNLVSSYLNRVQEFMLLLAITIYFTSGMPPRGQDLLNTKIRNTLHSNRNVYWHDNDFILKGGHYKQTNITNQDSQVIRVLAPQVGVILLKYHTYMLPAIYLLSQTTSTTKFHKESSESTAKGLYWTHLFVSNSKLLDRSKVSKKLKELSEAAFGTALSLRHWRQILSAISRKHITFLEHNYFDLELQFGHSMNVGARHYGTTSRSFSDVPYYISEKEIGLSRDWQVMWGLRKKGNNPTTLCEKTAAEIKRILASGEDDGELIDIDRPWKGTKML